jgi:hypothetical protein
MNKSEQINELTHALSQAQGEIRDAVKDSVNPHFKNAYADLASILEACRGPLSKNDLAVMQMPFTTAEGNVGLTTLLSHSSGQFVTSELILVPRDPSPQSYGSCVTYARRYSLMAMVGIAPADDDDGNSASLPKKPESVDKPTPIVVKPPKAQEVQKSFPEDREALTKRLAAIYRPFMTAYPNTIYAGLLQERYKVGESKFLSLEQLSDLVEFLEAGIEAAK